MQTSETVSITTTGANTTDILTECISDVDEGPDKANILDSQCSGNLTFELADATAEMKLAPAQTSMIGAGNAKRPHTTITRSAGTATRITGKRPAASCDYQDHHHIENYLTENLWALIGSDCTIHQKLASTAEFVVDKLGLHYAEELTYASIVGVIVAAHAKPVNYQIAHDYLNEFKVYAGGTG